MKIQPQKQMIDGITLTALGFIVSQEFKDGEPGAGALYTGPYILALTNNGDNVYQLGAGSFSQSIGENQMKEGALHYLFECESERYGRSTGGATLTPKRLGHPFGLEKKLFVSTYENSYASTGLVRHGVAYFCDPILHPNPIFLSSDFDEAWRHLTHGVNAQSFWPGVKHVLQARQSRDCC